MEKTSLASLYAAFFKCGAVTFGGGYTMLPILEKEISEKHGWVGKDDLLDYYAVSQSLPGLIAVNVSIFIGYRQRKLPGAIAAALGVVSPCLVIIMLIAACLTNFRDNAYVQYALHGISACVCALILSSLVGLWKKGVKDIPALVIFLIALALSLFTDLSPVFTVLLGAAAGLLLKGRKRS